MQNHAYMPEGMLHNTFSNESLPKGGTKEGEISPHMAPRTDTYVHAINKTM